MDVDKRAMLSLIFFEQPMRRMILDFFKARMREGKRIFAKAVNGYVDMWIDNVNIVLKSY